MMTTMTIPFQLQRNWALHMHILSKPSIIHMFRWVGQNADAKKRCFKNWSPKSKPKTSSPFHFRTLIGILIQPRKTRASHSRVRLIASKMIQLKTSNFYRFSVSFDVAYLGNLLRIIVGKKNPPTSAEFPTWKHEILIQSIICYLYSLQNLLDKSFETTNLFYILW